MDRKTYLLMCRECAMLETDAKGIPYYIPNRLKVVWNGLEFYPMELTISFDKQGNVQNHCRFHDLRANSIAGAELWEVKPKVEGQEQEAN